MSQLGSSEHGSLRDSDLYAFSPSRSPCQCHCPVLIIRFVDPSDPLGARGTIDENIQHISLRYVGCFRRTLYEYNSPHYQFCHIAMTVGVEHSYYTSITTVSSGFDSNPFKTYIMMQLTSYDKKVPFSCKCHVVFLTKYCHCHIMLFALQYMPSCIPQDLPERSRTVALIGIEFLVYADRFDSNSNLVGSIRRPVTPPNELSQLWPL